MSYIDSNVFIYPVIYSPESQKKARNAKEILLKIERGELKAYTSTLTWDEVVCVVTKTLGAEDGADVGRRLLGFPNLEYIDVDRRVLSSAQNLCEKHKIGPRDSIHLASAITKNIKHVISDDSDLDKTKEIERIPLI